MMRRGMQIVAPFRPFPPESELHREMADFDWDEAMQMMAHSARLACHCPVHMLTDVDTTLPVESFQYETHERRLMLWTLEVIACFLESPQCDLDTAIVDVDQLFYRDIAGWFVPGVDLTVMVRPEEKHVETGGQPLLNGIMWCARKSRKRLAHFYRQALDYARGLPEERIRWGADTDAVRALIEPIEIGIVARAGLTVQMINVDTVLETYSVRHAETLDRGGALIPLRHVMDFRWTRKPGLPRVYRATILKALEGAVA